MTYHACRKEVSRLDVVKCNITRHLSDRVTNRKDRVDLVELIALEVQLFPHARDIGIVQVGSIKVVEEIHKTAKCEDKKVQLLDKLSLARSILLAFEIAHKAVRHGEYSCFGVEIEIVTHRTLQHRRYNIVDVEILVAPSLYGSGQRHTKRVDGYRKPVPGRQMIEAQGSISCCLMLTREVHMQHLIANKPCR
jgi:hypothetical protein